MSKKTMRSKDAARPTTPGTTAKHGPATERAKRQARKAIADNIARIEQAERAGAAAHGEQPGEPQQPAADQNQPGQAEQPVVPAASGPAAHAETPAPAAKPAKRGAKAKVDTAAQPEPMSPAKGGAAETEKTAKKTKPKRLSCIDAAAQIIGTDPIGCADLIAEMSARGLWTSPNGKTPEASLYAAIIREISAKGDNARFKKVDRGLFVKNG